MNFPVKPFFVSPYKEESGGVDFLGLRQVNLALIDLFLPGINNKTYSLRPYSVMCWIAWGFRNAVHAEGFKDINSKQFKQFREKIEVLFNWSHQLNHSGAGMAGNAQVAPTNTEAELPLSFADWKRNVSWFDAVNYGPSAKVDNGLGFIKQPLPNVFAPTKIGENLAIALDMILRSRESYPFLTGLNVSKASPDVALDLYEAWRISSPSSKESEIYRNALYDESAIGESTRLGNRSASIKLILRTLQIFSKPASTDELRRFMANTNLFNDKAAKEDEPLAKMHAVWRVLQIRQAQRLAFEVMFGWIEYRLMEFSRTQSSELVEDFISAIKIHSSSAVVDNWITDYLVSIKSKQDSSGDLFSAAAEDDEVDVCQWVTSRITT